MIKRLQDEVKYDWHFVARKPWSTYLCVWQYLQSSAQPSNNTYIFSIDTPFYRRWLIGSVCCRSGLRITGFIATQKMHVTAFWRIFFLWRLKKKNHGCARPLQRKESRLEQLFMTVRIQRSSFKLRISRTTISNLNYNLHVTRVACTPGNWHALTDQYYFMYF